MAMACRSFKPRVRGRCRERRVKPLWGEARADELNRGAASALSQPAVARIPPAAGDTCL